MTIRTEVDMVRKLVVQRMEDAMTVEDLRGDAELWSNPLLEHYANVLNVGLADVSSITMEELQTHCDELSRCAFSAPVVIVVNTDEQRRLTQTFFQLAKAAGLGVDGWRIFDDEEEAIEWALANHFHET